MRCSRRNIVLTFLLTLIPLTIAPGPSALAPAVKDANAIAANVNGQLSICNPPNPCITAKLQANMSGPDAQVLAGSLLIYASAPSPPQSCTANVTGSAVLPMNQAPTATLTGTLISTGPTAAACVGGLQGLSVTLYIDSTSGIIQLTTQTSTGVTETLAVGTGILMITQTETG